MKEKLIEAISRKGLSSFYTQNLFDEYHRFLILKYHYSENIICPVGLLDTWFLHGSMEKDYITFCTDNFSTIIPISLPGSLYSYTNHTDTIEIYRSFFKVPENQDCWYYNCDEELYKKAIDNLKLLSISNNSKLNLNHYPIIKKIIPTDIDISLIPSGYLSRIHQKGINSIPIRQAEIQLLPRAYNYNQQSLDDDEEEEEEDKVFIGSMIAYEEPLMSIKKENRYVTRTGLRHCENKTTLISGLVEDIPTFNDIIDLRSSKPIRCRAQYEAPDKFTGDPVISQFFVESKRNTTKLEQPYETLIGEDDGNQSDSVSNLNEGLNIYRTIGSIDTDEKLTDDIEKYCLDFRQKRSHLDGHIGYKPGVIDKGGVTNIKQKPKENKYTTKKQTTAYQERNIIYTTKNISELPTKNNHKHNKDNIKNSNKNTSVKQVQAHTLEESMNKLQKIMIKNFQEDRREIKRSPKTEKLSTSVTPKIRSASLGRANAHSRHINKEVNSEEKPLTSKHQRLSSIAQMTCKNKLLSPIFEKSSPLERIPLSDMKKYTNVVLNDNINKPRGIILSNNISRNTSNSRHISNKRTTKDKKLGEQRRSESTNKNVTALREALVTGQKRKQILDPDGYVYKSKEKPKRDCCIPQSIKETSYEKNISNKRNISGTRPNMLKSNIQPKGVSTKGNNISAIKQKKRSASSADCKNHQNLRTIHASTRGLVPERRVQSKGQENQTTREKLTKSRDSAKKLEIRSSQESTRSDTGIAASKKDFEMQPSIGTSDISQPSVVYSRVINHVRGN